MIATLYLTAKDISQELGVSRTRAYKILKQCTRIVGGRTVRVSRQAFEAWKERHTECPTYEANDTPSFSGSLRLARGGRSSQTRTGAVPLERRLASEMKAPPTPGFLLEYAALLAPSRPRTRKPAGNDH